MTRVTPTPFQGRFSSGPEFGYELVTETEVTT